MEKELILLTKQMGMKGKKAARSLSILIGLVDLFSKTRKPVSSQVLKDEMFSDLSTATIRNHLFDLEALGYLKQVHTSGGREPTPSAVKLYCNVLTREIDSNGIRSKAAELVNLSEIEKIFQKYINDDISEKPDFFSIFEFLMSHLTNMSGCIGLISVPTFEHDLVAEIKLIRINVRRVLAVIITQCGFLDTETLYVDQDLLDDQVEKIQNNIKMLINGATNEEHSECSLYDLSRQIYNELSVRYIIKKSMLCNETIIKSGLSQLTKSENFFDSNSINDVINIVESKDAICSILSSVRSTNSIQTIICNERFPQCCDHESIYIFGCPYMLKNTIIGSLILITSKNALFKKIIVLLKVFQSKIASLLDLYLVRLKIDLKRFCITTKSMTAGARLNSLTNTDK